MKIAYVCNEYPPVPHGGIGTFVQMMARAMKARGHEVTVVGMGNSDGVRDDFGIRVATIGRAHAPRLSWLLDRWKLHRWLARETTEGRIEIVETPDYEGMLPLPLRACPVVVRLHLAGAIIARQANARPARVLSFCERQTLRQHGDWIAVSEYILGLTAETFHLKPAAAHVIHNPAALPAGNGATLEARLPPEFVLYVGTVSARKGAYTLALAARRFLTDHPGLHLVYVGAILQDESVPADERIRDILTQRLAARVLFLGRIPHSAVAVCMRRAKLFASPSNLESFSLVTAEAMLAGLPVVVSDNGPFPEFVQHGKTGLLVPPHDPAALADAIEQLLQSEALRSKLGTHAAKDIGARFSLTQCAAESEHCYAAILSRRGNSRRLAARTRPDINTSKRDAG